MSVTDEHNQRPATTTDLQHLSGLIDARLTRLERRVRHLEWLVGLAGLVFGAVVLLLHWTGGLR